MEKVCNEIANNYTDNKSHLCCLFSTGKYADIRFLKMSQRIKMVCNCTILVLLYCVNQLLTMYVYVL